MARLKETKRKTVRRSLYNTEVVRAFVERVGSQSAAAKAIGVDPATVHRATVGENISIRTFWAIVDAIGITGRELLGEP